MRAWSASSTSSALATLTENEQVLLLLTYRDRQCHEIVSKVLHCSVRKLVYDLPRPASA